MNFPFPIACMDNDRWNSFNNLLKHIQDYVSDSGTLPEIIDPMTCLLRLALIAFHPPNTKIAITNHRITLHPPSMLQGPMRWISGFERGDCHLLLKPIERSIAMFGESNSEDVKKIFVFASIGLTKLADTYRGKSTIIVHIIELYIKILKNKNFKDKTKSESHKYCHNDIMKIFKNLWTEDELKIVRLMFDQCTKSSVFKTMLDTFLSHKEDILHERVLKYTDTI